MRRRKLLYLCALGVLTSVLLTGCGDGSEENSVLAQEALSVNSEPLLSVTERAIYDYELKYHTATFEMQDYYALAELYGEVGRIREQRDMLEQSYRLFGDLEALEELQGIAVNLAEEEEVIAAESALMLQNLELPEYLDEAVNMIVNSNWMRVMMPKLTVGSRNYFLQRDGRTVLTVQVGYDEAGLPYSNVWYVNDDNQLILLQYADTTVKLLQTTLLEGAYDGAFEMWLVDGATGNIVHEQGSFAQGICTDAYTRQIHVGTESSDLFALWCNWQGMEYLAYAGHFDEQGRTTLQQPDAENLAVLLEGSGMASCIVYAYDEMGQNCLFEVLENDVDPAAYTFGVDFMGVESYPAYEVYEVEVDNDAETESNADDVQIRVFDGEIQYFNGYRWVSVGTAKDLADADPFRAYAERKEAFENKLWGVEISNTGVDGENADASELDEGEADANAGNNLGMGSITVTPTPTVTPVATPTPTKKPAANAGTTPVVQKPVATPTPTPTPVPSVPEPDDDDDDDSGSGSGTSTPVVPDDTGSGGSGDTGGGDAGDNGSDDSGGDGGSGETGGGDAGDSGSGDSGGDDGSGDSGGDDAGDSGSDDNTGDGDDMDYSDGEYSNPVL